MARTKSETPAEPASRTRRFASPAAGAAYYQVSLRTFRMLMARGEITAYRIPGSRLLRIDLDELDEKLQPIPTIGCSAATGSRPVASRPKPPAAKRGSAPQRAARASRRPDEAA